MNDVPRKILIQIIAEYGPGLVDEPRRVEGLLKDLCGEHKREINTLMDAARERVAQDLRAGAATGMPPEVLVSTLTRRLLENRPMSDEIARWAVESWAAALGLDLSAVLSSSAVAPLPNTSRLPVKTPLNPSAPAAGPIQPASPRRRVELPANPNPPMPARAPREMTLKLAPELEMIFVQVPPGPFLMGSDPAVDPQARPSEIPQHVVTLDGFWIGKFPVTNQQYLAFVKATRHKPPRYWANGMIPTALEEFPVWGITWQDAQDFCDWGSGPLGQQVLRWVSGLFNGRRLRLPSEAEWEKAARGTDGRRYPWGNDDPDGQRFHLTTHNTTFTRVGRFSPLGDSPYGCCDMVGSVWQWCNDWSDSNNRYDYADGPATNPTGPTTGQYRVVRGGRFGYLNYCPPHCAMRGAAPPNSFEGYTGFRVAFSEKTA